MSPKPEDKKIIMSRNSIKSPNSNKRLSQSIINNKLIDNENVSIFDISSKNNNYNKVMTSRNSVTSSKVNKSKISINKDSNTNNIGKNSINFHEKKNFEKTSLKYTPKNSLKSNENLEADNIIINFESRKNVLKVEDMINK